MKLGGVTLNVKDLEAAKHFYERLPGSQLVRDEPDLASFDFGGARISLRRSGETGFHLEMEAPDVSAESDLLAREGVEPVERREDKFFLSDPDGHRIEVEAGDGGGSGVPIRNPQRDEENAGIG